MKIWPIFAKKNLFHENEIFVETLQIIAKFSFFRKLENVIDPFYIYLLFYHL